MKFTSFHAAHQAKLETSEKQLLGKPMWVKWDRAASKQYEGMGILADYKGIPDPDFQLQYIEAQMLILYNKQKSESDAILK